MVGCVILLNAGLSLNLRLELNLVLVLVKLGAFNPGIILNYQNIQS